MVSIHLSLLPQGGEGRGEEADSQFKSHHSGPFHEADHGARVCDPQQLGLQGDVLRLTEPRSVPAARFMVPMHAKDRKEAPHEPDVHPQVFGSARTCPRFVSTRHVASRKAATCRRTPRRCRGNWFMVPIHGRGRKEAFHELDFGARTALSARTRFAKLADKAVRAPVRRGFMVPMHAKNRKEAFHELGNIEHRMRAKDRKRPPHPSPLPQGGEGEAAAGRAAARLHEPGNIEHRTSNIQHRMRKTENGPLTPTLSPKGEREKTSQKHHRVQGFNARAFSGNSLPVCGWQ